MSKIILFLLVISVLNIEAQTGVQSIDTPLSVDQANKVYDKFRAMSPKEFKEYLKKEHPRVPHETQEKLKTFKKKELTLNEKKEENKPSTLSLRSSVLPDDASFTGEWEEMQGVFVSWPYLTASLIDTMRADPFAEVWISICNGVQLGGATIYINVRAAKDSFAVLKYMTDKGSPLVNYRFLINPGDDFWARDFGPIPYYYDTDDKIGWVDFKYYNGRDKDNLLPIKWANQIGGINVKTSKLFYEGGNIIMNSMTNEIIGSDMVEDLNKAMLGLTPAKVRDSIKEYLNTSNVKLVPYLLQEGGTGHIDLYVQRADESSIVYGQMPIEMKNIPTDSNGMDIWEDYMIASDNIDTLRKATTPFDNKLNYFNSIPLPKNDGNDWYQSGKEYEQYTRTYSNSLVVNNVIVLPIFYNDVDGNKTWDLAAVERVKKAFPGYEIVTADMRFFDGSGGSIHCVTKEFPATNPIRIFHYQYRDSALYQSKFPVNATLKNQSGIQNAIINYRIKGSTVWSKVTMTSTGNNNYFGNILASNKGGETIEYYIEATSVNGKTMKKPYPAPKGFYSFKIGNNPSPSNAIVLNSIDIDKIYPNPASSTLTLSISNPTNFPVEIKITDIHGKNVLTQIVKNNFNSISLDINSLATGNYFVEIYVEGKMKSLRKITKL